MEQLHALARDVFYGRRGRINARELWEQMNSCSCGAAFETVAALTGREKRGSTKADPRLLRYV